MQNAIASIRVSLAISGVYLVPSQINKMHVWSSIAWGIYAHEMPSRSSLVGPREKMTSLYRIVYLISRLFLPSRISRFYHRLLIVVKTIPRWASMTYDCTIISDSILWYCNACK